MDRLLRGVDEIFELSQFQTLTYLALVFLFSFGLTIALFALSQKLSSPCKDKRHKFSKVIFRFTSSILIINIVFFLIGTLTSLKAFHYSSFLVISILLIPITAYLLLFIDKELFKIEMLILFLIVIAAFIFSLKHLVNGVEEHEDVSDMIYIYTNGRYRWSINGPHYDLAPLNSITKVILSFAVGTNVYDATLATILYSFYGLATLLFLYVLTRRLYNDLAATISIILLSTLSYPYSPIINLNTPAAPQASLLATIALIIVFKSLLGFRVFSVEDYIATTILIISSMLMHPTSLALLMYLASIILLLRYRKELIKHKYVMHVFLLAFATYILKALYTAFATNFINFVQTQIEYIHAIIGREVTTVTTRNPGYSTLPRICLTGFAVFPGFIGGLALMLIFKIRRAISFVEQYFLVTLFTYATLAFASLLSSLIEISQSRIFFNGAQPYMELALIIYLITFLSKAKKRLILIPLLIASFSVLITPNSLPLNYTIPMSAKHATLNDHIIAYTFTELLSKNFYIDLYSSCGRLSRIVTLQEREEYYYNFESTMASVYYFIVPGIVPAKSYWDPCIMAIYAEPKDVTGYVVNRVFDAWVYGFYIYAKR